MAESDHEQLADRLEQEAQAMQDRSHELDHELSEIREDWEAKRADPAVPGAPPPPDDEMPADQPRDSPAPEAPPPEAHPADAEAPSESAVGPAADER